MDSTMTTNGCFATSPDATSSSSRLRHRLGRPRVAAERAAACATPEADQAVAAAAHRRRTSRRRRSRSFTCSWPARRRSWICSTTSRRCASTTARRSRGVRPQGRAVRVHQGHAAAARLAASLQAARPVGRRDLGTAAPPAKHRGRNRHHPLDADDAVQPCAGADLHEHRAPDHRAPQHRLVAQLRPGQRQQGSARLRRA